MFCYVPGPNAIFCSFQSLDAMIREHPEYNRNQIRELAQTLMDGRVLHELIHRKVEDYNIRWDELMQRVIVIIFGLSLTVPIILYWNLISRALFSLFAMTGITKAATTGKELAVGSRKWQNPASYSRFSKCNWSSFNCISCRWNRCRSNTSGSSGLHFCHKAQYFVYHCRHMIFQSYVRNTAGYLWTSEDRMQSYVTGCYIKRKYLCTWKCVSFVYRKFRLS